MKMTAADFIRIIADLQADGLTLKLAADGTISLCDSRRAKKTARQARWRARKRAGIIGTPTLQGKSAYLAPTRELVWRDMPGHDEAAKKMNLSLFKRRMLDQYNHLHGRPVEEIKAEFARLNAGQKAKSQLAATKRTADAQARKASKAAI